MCGSSKGSKFLGGIILGALMGAVAGVLFAPTSGKETREKIKKLVDENGELINDTKVKTQAIVNKTVDAIREGIDRIKDKDKGPKSPYDRYSGPDDNSEAAA